MKDFIDSTIRLLKVPSWHGLSMFLAFGFGFLGISALLAFQIPVAVFMFLAAGICMRAHFLEKY